MDVYLGARNPISVEFVERDNNMAFPTLRKIDVLFDKRSIDVNMSRTKGPELSMFANMIRGASVIRLSQSEFDSLGSPRKDVWYFVTNTSGSKILKIYAGSELFAEADKSGNIGFPYTFPMTF